MIANLLGGMTAWEVGPTGCRRRADVLDGNDRVFKESSSRC